MFTIFLGYKSSFIACHLPWLQVIFCCALCDEDEETSQPWFVSQHVTRDGNKLSLCLGNSSDYYFLKIFAGNILGQCVSVSVEVARSENKGLKFAK